MLTPRNTLSALALLTLLATTAACAGTTTSTHKAAHRTTSHRGQVVPTATAPAVPGTLVHVHDPGQVTYSVNPSGCHITGSGTQILQDPHCTPGAIDPAITQDNIKQTICKSGYTATVRPPVADTNVAKRKSYTAYGIAPGTTSELDHLVSLELGGANDIANLWPEIGPLPNPKDSVENRLHKAVCAGQVTLSAAQLAIATDWRTAEQRLNLS